MLYLSIPTLDDLDLLRQLWIDVSDILESGAFLSLKTLTVFLLKRPPADALDTAALVRELHDWMPLLDSRALLRVFPCLGLDA